MDLRPGDIVSHYRIEEKIGEGGMGVVYRALNLRLESDVALKFLSSRSVTDEQAKRKFVKEARILAQLHHPNIATVHDLDDYEGTDFIVMEYVPGVTLNDMLSDRRLDEGESLRLIGQLLDGLAAAHAERVIHRDVKPGNLRVAPDEHLKILDFGLAKLIKLPSDTATTTTMSETFRVAGTLPYMAPETLQGEGHDERTDIYSAGVVMYEALAGQRPFNYDTSRDLTHAILHERPAKLREHNPNLSSSLEHIVLKTLEKDPQDRFQSVRALRFELHSYLVGPGPTWWERHARLMTTLVAILAAFLLLYVIDERRKRAPFENPVMQVIATWPGDEYVGRFSPDGSQLSFQSEQGGEQKLWVAQTGIGKPRLFDPQPNNVLSHVWAPDGGSLAILHLSEQQVLIQFVRPGSGAPYRSVRLAPAFSGGILRSWNGSHVFIEVEGSGFYQLDTENGQTQKLIDARGEGFDIRKNFDVCAQGKQVVFTQRKSGRRSVWVSNLDASDAKQLTRSDFDSFKPRWMGADCRHILYSSDQSGQTDVWGMALAKRSSHRITFGTGIETVEDTSPDAAWALFLERDRRADLYLVDIRAGDPKVQQLTADDLRDLYPSTSTNHKKIVFQRTRPEPTRYVATFGSSIHIADFSNLRVHEPTLVVEIGGGALLSPTGEWLAYVAPHPERGYDLWMLDTRGLHRFSVSRYFSMPTSHPFPREYLSRKLTWSAKDEAFWVANVPNRIQEIRRIRPTLDEPRSELIVAGESGEEFTELAVSPGTEWLGYVRSPDGSKVNELVCRNLMTGESKVLLRYAHEQPGFLLCRGWLGTSDSLVVLRTVAGPITQNTEVLLVSLSGTHRSVGAIDQSFPGTAVVDTEKKVLYVTRLDEEGTTHNIYSFDLLRDGGLRRVTENIVPGVSFGAGWVVQPGLFVVSRQVENMNLELVRFDRR